MIILTFLSTAWNVAANSSWKHDYSNVVDFNKSINQIKYTFQKCCLIFAKNNFRYNESYTCVISSISKQYILCMLSIILIAYIWISCFVYLIMLIWVITNLGILTSIIVRRLIFIFVIWILWNERKLNLLLFPPLKKTKWFRRLKIKWYSVFKTKWKRNKNSISNWAYGAQKFVKRVASLIKKHSFLNSNSIHFLFKFPK